MTPEYAEIFKKPVRFRIIEKKTPILEEFAASINTEKIISVPCKPRPWAERKRCFVNVERLLELNGGRMITGWIFNEFEDRSIEAEAHAIWIDRLGKRRFDITPHDFQPARVLFLPDPKVAKKRGYTAHPRTMVSDDPRLIAIEAFDSAIQQLREDNFQGFGKELIILQHEYEEARDNSGLPDDVASFLLQKYQDSDDKSWAMYGKE